MRRLLGLLVAGLVLTSWASASAADGRPQLFMPSGQLKSHPVRVYVTQDLFSQSATSAQACFGAMP